MTTLAQHCLWPTVNAHERPVKALSVVLYKSDEAPLVPYGAIPRGPGLSFFCRTHLLCNSPERKKARERLIFVEAALEGNSGLVNCIRYETRLLSQEMKLQHFPSNN